MTQSKKVQFQIRKQDVTIDLFYPKDYEAGVFWSYPDSPTAGPFRDEAQAIEDAKLYSTYGTTNKQLLKKGSGHSLVDGMIKKRQEMYAYDLPGLSTTKYIRKKYNG